MWGNEEEGSLTSRKLKLEEGLPVGELREGSDSGCTFARDIDESVNVVSMMIVLFTQH